MAEYPKNCDTGDDCLVDGEDGWNGSGDEAIYYMGDTNHYIKGKYGTGVIIGTAGVGDTIYLEENTGNVGLGQSSPDQRLHINGRIAFDTQSTPGSPSVGTAVMWWDGNDLKVMRNVGGSVKSCTITGSWS